MRCPVEACGSPKRPGSDEREQKYNHEAAGQDMVRRAAEGFLSDIA
jgi:hypothetical protein